MVEPDWVDHVVDGLVKARQNEAGVAPRSRPGDAVRLQHRHGPFALRHLPRDGQAGEAGADHADINIEIEVEPRVFGACNPGRLVPTRFCVLAFAHRFPAPIDHTAAPTMCMLDCCRFDIDALLNPQSDTPCAVSCCFAMPKPNDPSPA